MICPKCGFEQPESLDCVRCGIVFARYRGGTGSVYTPPPAPPAPPAPAVPPGRPAGGRNLAAAPPAASGLDFAPPPPEPPPQAAGETLFDPLAPIKPKAGSSSSRIWMRTLHGSDLVREAFSTFWSNAFSFSLLSGLALSPTLLIQAYLSAAKIETPTEVGGALLAGIGSLVGQPLATAAVSYGVFKQMRGEDTTLGACLGVGFSSLGRVLLVIIVQGIAMTLGLLCCVVPYLIMVAMYSVTVPVAVEERLGPFASLRRSSDLTLGYRWPIWRTLCSFGALAVVLTAGGELLVENVLQVPKATDLVTALVNVVTTGLSATACAVIYYRVRSLKESIDVDQISSVFS